jgi:hypothetical protein
MQAIKNGLVNLDRSLFQSDNQFNLYNMVRDGIVDVRDIDFCKSLATWPLHKPLSANQAAWVDKMVLRYENVAAANSTPQVVNSTPRSVYAPFDFSPVMALFANAKQQLKFPKITLMLTKSNKKVMIKFNQRNNELELKCPGYYGSEWYGRVNVANNELFLRRLGTQFKDELFALFAELIADPIAIVIQHGKLTGNCCFCSLPLSDPTSLKAGYGPICAGHYRLPYGDNQKHISAVTDWVCGPVAA